MTFKSLRSWVESQQQEDHEDKAMLELKRRLEGRPFYIWNLEHYKIMESRVNCCFQHVIPAGLPKKDGKEFPLFNYEAILYKALMMPAYLNSSPSVNKMGETLEARIKRERGAREDYLYDFKIKHLWCKKATGLGVTEFMLRFMCWLCLRNDDYKDSQMCIIVGPNYDLACKMIKRMKAFFAPQIYFDSKESVLELNGCNIQAYPSDNLGSFRSLTSPKFILIEEADYFPKSEQLEVRMTAERYQAKSDPSLYPMHSL